MKSNSKCSKRVPSQKGRVRKAGMSRPIAVLLSVFLLFQPVSAFSFITVTDFISGSDLSNVNDGATFIRQAADPTITDLGLVDPTANVFQHGVGNRAEIRQAGDRALSFVQQDGFRNHADIQQTSTANDSDDVIMLFQVGHGNVSTLSSNGFGNRILAKQVGFRNTANIGQEGIGNLALLVQRGAKNDATINQAGERNVAAILQKGFHNTASIDQTEASAIPGSGLNCQGPVDACRIGGGITIPNHLNHARISQYGIENVAAITQRGVHNRAGIHQFGTNEAAVVQNGAHNMAGIVQAGTGNIADVSQAGFHNRAIVKQFSTNASATIVQHGNGNSAAVFQSGNNPPPVICVQSFCIPLP